MKKYILFLTLSLLFVSCAPAYIPNVLNVPLLSEKGDLNVAINAGLSGYDPQVSYAINNHLGVLLNASFLNIVPGSVNSQRNSFIESGAGYFTSFGKYGRFETYGGVGYGSVLKYKDPSIVNSTDQQYNNLRFFVQPNIGLETSIFEGSFSPRFVLANIFHNNSVVSGTFIEPVITAKLGYKSVKGILQLGFSLPVYPVSTNFTYQPFFLSVGLQFKLSDWFKKRK